jgi:two-component system sensor histidine kinase GlrK
MFEFDLKIRSLRQLILGCFLLALIPLFVLLWLSQSDIAKLRAYTEKNTEFFVNTSGSMQTLGRIALDIERLTLQHFILPNDTLKQLNDQTITLFRERLTPLCMSEIKSNACGRLVEQLAQLGNYSQMSDKAVVDAQLDSFKNALESLRQDVDTQIDQAVIEQQMSMSYMQKRQAWLTAVLTFVSLALILFAAQLIVKPVKKLKDIIQAIANNDNRLPAKSSSSPRELLTVERDLYSLHNRIQHLEKVRMALLRHASHELKTPLASMKEGCALLNDNALGEMNSAQKEVLGLVNKSTERLETLILKLLDYNSLLQQAEPEYIELNTNSVVEESIRDNALALSQSNREVDVDISPDESLIMTDAELFRRIIDNLLSNAIAHGRKNTPIKLSISGNNHSVFLDVSNLGSPISEDDRATIFEPFKRGHSERNDRVIGAGLGLSIVSDCANLLDGDVTIMEVEGADVCFRVKLKRREE